MRRIVASVLLYLGLAIGVVGGLGLALDWGVDDQDGTAPEPPGPVSGQAILEQDPPENCEAAPTTITFAVTVDVTEGQLRITSPGGTASGPLTAWTARLTGPGGETYDLRSAEPADAPTRLLMGTQARGCTFRTTVDLEAPLPWNARPEPAVAASSDDDIRTFWTGLLIGGGALAVIGFVMLLWRGRAGTDRKRAEALAPILDQIKDVNPGGGVLNSVFCALCAESCFAGTPASAAEDPPHPAPVSWLREIAQTRWGTALGVYSSQREVSAATADLGSGHRAILLLIRPDGTGHAINVVNVDGFVFFVDGQRGTEFTEWTDGTFHLIRTTK